MDTQGLKSLIPSVFPLNKLKRSTDGPPFAASLITDMDFLGPIPIQIVFSSALADGRHTDTNFLETTLGADTAAFAPSIG